MEKRIFKAYFGLASPIPRFPLDKLNKKVQKRNARESINFLCRPIGLDESCACRELKSMGTRKRR
jgi:hypothetical protein